MHDAGHLQPGGLPHARHACHGHAVWVLLVVAGPMQGGVSNGALPAVPGAQPRVLPGALPASLAYRRVRQPVLQQRLFPAAPSPGASCSLSLAALHACFHTRAPGSGCCMRWNTLPARSRLDRVWPAPARACSHTRPAPAAACIGTRSSGASPSACLPPAPPCPACSASSRAWTAGMCRRWSTPPGTRRPRWLTRTSWTPAPMVGSCPARRGRPALPCLPWAAAWRGSPPVRLPLLSLLGVGERCHVMMSHGAPLPPPSLALEPGRALAPCAGGNNSPMIAPHTGSPTLTVPMGFTREWSRGQCCWKPHSSAAASLER